MCIHRSRRQLEQKRLFGLEARGANLKLSPELQLGEGQQHIQVQYDAMGRNVKEGCVPVLTKIALRWKMDWMAPKALEEPAQ